MVAWNSNQNNCVLKNMLVDAHVRALRSGDPKKIVSAAVELANHEKTCSICSPALELFPNAKIGG